MDQAESHPVYGKLLIERRPNVAFWTIAGVGTALIAAAILVYGIGTLFNPSMHVSAAGSIAAMCVGALGMAAGVGVPIARQSKRVTFYERGVVQRRWGSERAAFAYEDIGECGFSTTRQYLSGVYAGTVYHLVMAAMTPGGIREISVGGLHAERSKGLGFTILYQQFEGEDDVDVITRMIARSMVVKRLRDEADPRVRWCGMAELCSLGLTPLTGSLKHVLVPYEAMSTRAASSEGGAYLRLFRAGERSAFLNVPVAGANYLVGIEFMKAIADCAREVAPDEEALARA